METFYSNCFFNNLLNVFNSEDFLSGHFTKKPLYSYYFSKNLLNVFLDNSFHIL